MVTANFEKLKFLKDLLEIPFVKKAVIVVITFFFFYFLIRIINFLIKNILNRISDKSKDIEFKKQVHTVRNIVISIVDTIFGTIMIFQILDVLGIDIRPLLAAAGVAGVAIGFGAKSFVEDIITGFGILLTGQIRVGDWVQIGTSQGIVQQVDIRMIVLRDLEGSVHYISNRLVDKVINHTKEFAYAMFEVDIAYKEDVRHVIEILKELGRTIRQDKVLGKHIKSDLEMFGLDSFEMSSVRIKCRIKTHPAHKLDVFREFNLLIKEKFDKEGIEIPFNQITVNQPNI